MSYSSWFNTPRISRRSRELAAPLRRRLFLEGLEDRRLLAFIGPLDYAGGSNPQAADFNNDGQLDLATVTYAADSTTISVVLGDGDGTFQRPSLSSPTGVGPWGSLGPFLQSVAVGDFDDDGNLDVAGGTYDYYGVQNDVVILLGNGDGTFDAAAPVSITQGYTSSYVTTGFLNGDDMLDLVITSDDVYGHGGQSVSVLLGRGDGTFAWSGWYGVHDSSPIGDGPIDIYTPVLADYNGDGAVDVAVPASTYADGAFVKVYLGNGDGTLQQPHDTAAGVNSVLAGDFNGDNLSDLVTNGGIRLSNGDGTFQNARAIGALANAAGDINGDGRLDLVATKEGNVNVYLGDGAGSFAQPITAATGGYGSVVLADFNADGLPDAAANYGAVAVLLNDGDWPNPPPMLPWITIDDVTKNEGATNKTTLFTFTVRLSAASSESVTVNFAIVSGTATAGTDFVSKSGSVTFLPGETTKQITISIKGDKTKELDETFFVNLFAAIGGQISDGQGLGTILNDDAGGGAKGKP